MPGFLVLLAVINAIQLALRPESFDLVLRLQTLAVMLAVLIFAALLGGTLILYTYTALAGGVMSRTEREGRR